MSATATVKCENCSRMIGQQETYHHQGRVLCGRCYQANVPSWERESARQGQTDVQAIEAPASSTPKGYFNALTAGSFKKVGSQWTFFPWGALGRGYDIPSEAVHRRLRRFVRTFVTIGVLGVIFLGLTVKYFWIAGAIVLYSVLYVIQVRRLTASLSVSSTRLSFSESIEAQGLAHHLGVLWAMLALSGLFTAIGVLGAAILPDDRLVDSGVALFFGLCTWSFWRMLKARRLPKSKQHPADSGSAPQS